MPSRQQVRGVKSLRDWMAEGFRPRIVVKFQEGVGWPYRDGVERHFAGELRRRWGDLESAHPGLRVDRLFHLVHPEAILELTRHAAAVTPGYRAPDFHSYFAILSPRGADPRRLVETIRSWPLVDQAYIESPPQPPPHLADWDDPEAWDQGYLDDGIGIGIRHAWCYPGGDGSGVQFVDIEWGWQLDHEDLQRTSPIVLVPEGRAVNYADPDWRRHGTSVLGIVLAADNEKGCVGIAPGVGARVVSEYMQVEWPVPWRFGPARRWIVHSRANAIAYATEILGPGDVMLLESQVADLETLLTYPVEYEQANFDVIKLATSKGIVVVEAAGDSFADLNDVPDGRFDRAVRDSGAILVGGVEKPADGPSPTLETWGLSDYGSRVDCCAWAKGVTTLDAAPDGYTKEFGGTSSAAAIIAGAAAVVQGLALRKHGHVLSPAEVRAILGDPATGTTPVSAEKVGVMPDFKRIVPKKLLPPQDIYVRDHEQDDGGWHEGPFGRSPDIIVKRELVADPGGSYGEGSGTENTVGLSDATLMGGKWFVYVRMRNRGGKPTGPVDVYVFQAPVATLVRPDMCRPVGLPVTVPSVPPGNKLVVAGPITAFEKPLPHSFVAIVHTAGDPGPSLSSLRSWNGLLSAIRYQNNVAWLNLHRIHGAPAADGSPNQTYSLRFRTTGATDEPRQMTLEVLGQLPAGAKVLLRVPASLADIAAFDSPPLGPPDENGDVWYALAPVAAAPRAVLSAALGPSACYPCELAVTCLPPAACACHEIAVLQRFGRMEIGRITWRLQP